MKERLKGLFLEKSMLVNIESLETYLNFCLTRGYDEVGYAENHHILPQSLFPGYVKESWNIVRLKYLDHVKAHELLAEALPEDRSAQYAHFLMKAQIGDLSEEQRIMNVRYLSGPGNPSKRIEVREKISEAKLGKRRPDMIGKRWFGASEEVVQGVLQKAAQANLGTVPVRLGNGEVIKVRKDDPRYLSGELKCIIGAKKGQKGPISDPRTKAKFLSTLESRKQKFASMSGEEITEFCLMAEAQGKQVIKGGKLAANYKRLFNYAGLNPDDFLQSKDDKVQRLSKAQPSTVR